MGPTADGRHHGTFHTTAALSAPNRKERHSSGAQFAVDTTTGKVRVRRMLGIFAAGRIVNPSPPATSSSAA
ncbi:hypothetical protein GCM10023082_50140 [Streptomyces tremellae]|uniref:Uncharacterized protein n=1 Tax=Streptomyces tremellae TaxID=1124239 RepID=A0ABP7FV21_9ACTN